MAFNEPVLMKLRLFSHTVYKSAVLSIAQSGVQMWNVLFGIHLSALMKVALPRHFSTKPVFAQRSYVHKAESTWEEKNIK